MEKKENAIKLAEHFGAVLAAAVFIVDREGNLLYYNEPAEHTLGRKFRETGPMEASVWSRIFLPMDEDGNPLLPETLPLLIALAENRPAFRKFWILGIDQVRREIEVAAFPIPSSRAGVQGAMAIFWEAQKG